MKHKRDVRHTSMGLDELRWLTWTRYSSSTILVAYMQPALIQTCAQYYDSLYKRIFLDEVTCLNWFEWPWNYLESLAGEIGVVSEHVTSSLQCTPLSKWRRGAIDI